MTRLAQFVADVKAVGAVLFLNVVVWLMVVEVTAVVWGPVVWVAWADGGAMRYVIDR